MVEMANRNALARIVTEAKKEAILEAIKSELELLKDLARGVKKEKDDLDLWLYVDDLESIAANLNAAVARLRKEIEDED